MKQKLTRFLTLFMALFCVVLLSSCSLEQIKYRVAPRHQHDYGEFVSNNDATCTEDGTKTGKCKSCGKVRTVVDRNSAGHKTVVSDAVAATCESSGITAGKSCSVCNEVIVVPKEVASLGHTYGDDNICEVCDHERKILAFEKKNYGEIEGYEVAGLYDLDMADIVVPAEYNELPVMSIGPEAFFGGVNIRSVEIPESVVAISAGVFSSCVNLESITVASENTVYKSIDNCIINIAEKSIVAGCKNSRIPDSEDVTRISQGAFYGCVGLRELFIPEAVTEIESGAFFGCSGLESILTASGNTVYSTDGNCLIKTETDNSTDPATETKKVVLGCKNSVIPEYVIAIGAGAFAGCFELTSIRIPAGVTAIENGAFDGCVKLVEVYNQSSLQIEKGSAENGGVAKNALNIRTAETDPVKVVTTAEGYVFYADGAEIYLLGYNGGQPTITLPRGYNNDTSAPYSVYAYAFMHNTKIVSITVSDGVNAVMDGAFYGCTALERVAFFKDVAYISPSAFNGNINLKNIIIPNDNQYYKSVDKCLIKIDKVGEVYENTLIYALGGGVIPADENVKYIGELAFIDCYNTDEITIPKSVTEIGRCALSGCTKFTDINYEGTVAEWNAVIKDDTWAFGIESYTVHCTDGDVVFPEASVAP